MKLDKDGNGSIDKEEFLNIPQIANNPLASRMIAIFDEECVGFSGCFGERGARLEEGELTMGPVQWWRNGRLPGVCGGSQCVQ